MSLVVTSNKPFSAWGDIFGDKVLEGEDLGVVDEAVDHRCGGEP